MTEAAPRRSSLFRLYGPVLVIVVLATLQSAFIMSHKEVMKRHNRRLIKQGHWIVEAEGISPSEWFDASIWDDILCAGISGMFVWSLCAAGFTPAAWLLLLPLIVAGGVTTTYHVVTTTIDCAPNLLPNLLSCG